MTSRHDDGEKHHVLPSGTLQVVLTDGGGNPSHTVRPGNCTSDCCRLSYHGRLSCCRLLLHLTVTLPEVEHLDRDRQVRTG